MPLCTRTVVNPFLTSFVQVRNEISFFAFRLVMSRRSGVWWFQLVLKNVKFTCKDNFTDDNCNSTVSLYTLLRSSKCFSCDWIQERHAVRTISEFVRLNPVNFFLLPSFSWNWWSFIPYQDIKMDNPKGY